ncbi:MAG: thioredoxin family protein [Chitinophagia bacterium]|jgi:thioredoxin-related protein|nr:thioredoxin family protein [Chitinophagia bacterium]
MKFLLSMLLVFSLNEVQWGTNLEQAEQTAQKEHKFILLSFSGSDWCGPCIRLHKEVFGSNAFEQLANEKLILVNADFPRYKKNQLSVSQQKINDALAEKYNKKGEFPLTVLLNAQGKLIKSWDGFPSVPNEFLEDIAQSIQDNQQ